MKFCEILRAIRTELNISQEQFARDLSVSFTTLNRWENNRTTPSRLAKMRIIDYCKARGISKEIIEMLDCT